MKKLSYTLVILIGLLLNIHVEAQQSPIWIRNMNTLPDSAYLFPVKTLADLNDNVFVLSTYYKQVPPSDFINKILLRKFSSNGNLLWSLDFDNNGVDQPRAFDMVLDDNGNAYVAGGLMDSPNFKPLLFKVNAMGVVSWSNEFTTAFNQGRYEQLLIKNNRLYLGCYSGIAVFDLNGNEQWSEAANYYRIGVDNSGRLLLSTFHNPTNSLIRYDLNGNIDVVDSTIVADRITVDSDNNIYLLAQWSNYQLAKLDSNGVLQWWTDALPQNPSFGDQGFELLVDYNNDVLLIGLADSMFKFHPDGSLVWKKSMQGMDSYIIDAKISNSNFLVVMGSLSNTQSVGIKVGIFDINGNQNWYGTHQSNTTQEFSVSMAISSDGIYVLEDSISNSSLLKFQSPFNSMTIDFSQLCVDSVWYEPGNPQLINVRVFNGSIGHLNYPSVQIVSPVGDTISNKLNFVDFFAHLGNSYQVYRDTITVSSINDFSNYTFLMNEGFGDTTVMISMCSTLGTNKIEENSFSMHPNPAQDFLSLEFDQPCVGCNVEIISLQGKILFSKKMDSTMFFRINIEKLAKGIYYVRILNDQKIKQLPLVKL